MLVNRNRRLGLGAIAVVAAAGTLAACSSGGSADNAGASSAPASSASTSASATPCPSGSSTLNGEGSTAQTNAITEWIKGYTAQCSGATVNYNPTGSGAGITSFNAGQVNFAGSDAALSASKGEVAGAQAACSSTPLDLPMVVGPIAVAYKLNGVDSLTLTPDVIAKIFTGAITTWNDQAIASINSGVNLPSSTISVIYRSDSSGTTQNFETYLQKAAPSVFTATPAKDNAATVFKGSGQAKSQGVAQAIASTEGSIGYDEYSFAVNGSLQTAKIDNGGGAVEVSKTTASAAAGAAKVVGTGDDLSLNLDYATKVQGAYPLILVTYEIVCTKYADATTGTNVKNFLEYTAGPGQASLASLGYAPLPSELQTKVQASIAKIS